MLFNILLYSHLKLFVNAIQGDFYIVTYIFNNCVALKENNIVISFKLCWVDFVSVLMFRDTMSCVISNGAVIADKTDFGIR